MLIHIRSVVLSLCFLLYVVPVMAQEWVVNAGHNQQIAVNAKGQMGYLEYKWKLDLSKSKLVVPYRFTWATPYDKNGHAVVGIDGKYGLMDTTGKYVIPLEYDHVYPFANSYARVYKGGKFGAVNKSGILVIPTEYDYLADFTEAGRADAVKLNRWGVINASNTIILPFNYVVARTDEKGYTRAFSTDWGYIDPAGKPILNETYQALDHLGNGYVMGIQTTLKKVLMNYQWENVLPEGIGYSGLHLKGNPCIVSKDGLYGLYDMVAKKMLTGFDYKYLAFNHGNIIRAQKSGAVGNFLYLDLKGNKLFGKEFQEALDFVDYTGFAEVKQNGKWGLINLKGIYILPCEMELEGNSSISVDVNAGLISSKKESGWGLTDLTGKILLPYQYAEPINKRANPFYITGEIKMDVVKDNKTGLKGIINDKGQWIFKAGNPEYDDFGIVDNFTDVAQALVPVAKNGKWGLYDLGSRKEIFSLSINTSLSTEYSHARFLTKEDKWGLVIYKTGKVYNPGEYEYTDFDPESQLLVIEKNGLVGLQDLNGKTVVSPAYISLTYDMETGYYYANKNGSVGFIDQKGKIKIPFDYLPKPMNSPAAFSNGVVQMNYAGKHMLLDKMGKTVLTATDFKGPNDMELFKTKFWGNTWCYMAMYKENNEKLVKIILNGRLYEQLNGDIFNSKSPFSVEFQEGIMVAKRDGFFGYLDHTGKEVTPFVYERAGVFEDGTAYVKQDGKYFKINRDGQRLKYNDIRLVLLKTAKK